jgi:UDP-N-acetylglucosamine acyltransferase
MTLQIHSTAIVDPLADLAPDVSVGPYAVIGPRVRIGETTSIGPHSVIVCNTRIGAGCSIGVGSVLGGEPQDRKYHHEETWLEIGDETVIRDYSTLNRGTGARGTTSIGRGCFLMTYVHVAHDCVIENGVVIANAVQLAGHVYVEEYATLGGSTPAAGNPYKLYGINVIGLTRAGFSAEVRLALKHAYRLLFNSDLPRTEAAERLRQEMRGVPEVQRLIDFVASSERGVLA